MLSEAKHLPKSEVGASVLRPARCFASLSMTDLWEIVSL
jgi:hypothetical protein